MAVVKKVGPSQIAPDLKQAVDAINDAVYQIAELEYRNDILKDREQRLKERLLAMQATLNQVDSAVQGRWPFMLKRTIRKILCQR